MKLNISISAAIPAKLKDDKKYAQLLVKVGKSKDKVDAAKLKVKEATAKLKEVEKELAADIKEADKYKQGIVGKPKTRLPVAGKSYRLSHYRPTGTDNAPWKWVESKDKVKVVSIEEGKIKFKFSDGSTRTIATKDVGKTTKFLPLA